MESEFRIVKDKLCFITKYTADDEEPDCMKCDHADAKYEDYCENCGPSHWWHNYINSEVAAYTPEEYERVLERFKKNSPEFYKVYMKTYFPNGLD